MRSSRSDENPQEEVVHEDPLIKNSGCRQPVRQRKLSVVFCFPFNSLLGAMLVKIISNFRHLKHASCLGSNCVEVTANFSFNCGIALGSVKTQHDEAVWCRVESNER